MKLLLFFFIVNAIFSSAIAEDVFDLAAKYNKKKNSVLNLESLKRETLSEIYEIEKKTNKLVLQKADLDKDKLKLDAQMAILSKKIVEIEEEIRQTTPDLTERIAFVEQINNLPWFYALLTSQTVMELDQLFEAANEINGKQANEVVDFFNLVTKLEEEKKELKKTALNIVLLKKDITRKEKDIELNQVAKNTKLKKLERSLKTEKSDLKKLKGLGKRAVESSMFKDLGLLFGVDFFDKKGKLPPPIEAPLVQKYGLNNGLSADRVSLIHKGFFYQDLAERPVHAVADGRVRFSGTVDGFGHVVVIDHGGRYYTTYANLQELKVKNNEQINTKHILGKTGHGHLQFGKGLYFEIRHFSQPQDPDDWLKPQNGNLATL